MILERLFFAIVFALIPLGSWVLEFVFSKSEGKISQFKNHFTCFYLDILFIPFNFLAVFSFNFMSFSKIMIIFIFSIISSFLMHKFWSKSPLEIDSTNFMFENKKISKAGRVHFLFFSFEFAFALIFFFSKITAIWFYAFLFLFLFLILIPLGSKKVHGKISPVDVIFSAITILLLFAKIVLEVFS